MPKVIAGRVYFTVAEASARVVVPFGTMHRWAQEGERGIATTVEVRRDANKLYVSQSSLKRLVAQEARWAEKHDLTTSSRDLTTAVVLREQLYASCFISYSTKDQDFADRLYSDLFLKGVSCWYAPHHAKGGQKLNDQLKREIDRRDRLLLIVSQHSMKSEWVKTEIANARQREVREKRKVLFPIGLAPFSSISRWKCFDADRRKDSAREIREYFIPDFSSWKDATSYQKVFSRLVEDLKIVEKS
jgi:hypothetical protein